MVCDDLRASGDDKFDLLSQVRKSLMRRMRMPVEDHFLSPLFQFTLNPATVLKTLLSQTRIKYIKA